MPKSITCHFAAEEGILAQDAMSWGGKGRHFIDLIEKLFQYWAVSILKTALQEI